MSRLKPYEIHEISSNYMSGAYCSKNVFKFHLRDIWIWYLFVMNNQWFDMNIPKTDFKHLKDEPAYA